ncbi:hypothetical protein AB0E27_38510 [Streptomyces sparsogenes]|uniref:hypothetical protein n=1 Tax=Streptomyces sparsogenes TaxID=67365 RepID=UPI0033CAEFC6
MLAPPQQSAAQQRAFAWLKETGHHGWPPPILLPNPVPSVDYRKVMTHLGFVDLAP